MKMVQEIKETIKRTKEQLDGMKRPTNYDETWDSQLAEMEGWINALEWVIEDESITDSEFNEITSGSLSLFDHVRIPVAGDYLYLGGDLGPVFEVDWVLFEIDSGNVVIAVTQLASVEKVFRDDFEKEREAKEDSVKGPDQISLR